MIPVPTPEVYAGLLLLLLGALPLGCLLLRGAEAWVGRRFRLAVTERLLLAFFATGALFFVVASVPIGLFALPTVLGLLVAGAVGYGWLEVRESGAGVRTTLQFLRSRTGLVLVLGSLGLLALEVVGGQVLLPNGVDGTVYALFVNVLLRHGNIVWTLQPYASTGILYPQGAPVWMGLPVLLFGWPTVSAPVTLPPLFLSFTIAAGYSLGERLRLLTGLGTPHAGLLMAAFFGLVASWPRLYVAGSYDFIFALPMFLVGLGLLASFCAGPPRPWREVVALGLLFGALTAISVAVGTALLLLLGGFLLYGVLARGGLLRAGARFLAVAALVAAFVARSFVGLAMWFSYPGHVLTATGARPYAPILNHETYAGWATQLDPFVPWKPKISPFPMLYLELELLLVAGLVLGAWAVSRRRGSTHELVSPRFARWAFVGTAVLFVETAVLLELGSVNTTISGIQSVTNVWETSFLLFILYALIAVLPLMAAARRLARPDSPERRESDQPTPSHRPARGGRQKARAMFVAALVIAVPLASGAATLVIVPSYLHSTIVAEANATLADVAALEWAGVHLPSCSNVLVAPGSAAQFLPEYADVHLVFPVFPSPTNRSYHDAVTDLTDGVFSNGTRTALLELGITEIFVTGPTTNAYPPFQTAPLDSSSDFVTVFAQGDASIFEFAAGAAATGCPPSS